MKHIRVLSENFQFLDVKFSIYIFESACFRNEAIYLEQFNMDLYLCRTSPPRGGRMGEILTIFELPGLYI